jgi:hypothetical protein
MSVVDGRGSLLVIVSSGTGVLGVMGAGRVGSASSGVAVATVAFAASAGGGVVVAFWPSDLQPGCKSMTVPATRWTKTTAVMVRASLEEFIGVYRCNFYAF